MGGRPWGSISPEPAKACQRPGFQGVFRGLLGALPEPPREGAPGSPPWGGSPGGSREPRGAHFGGYLITLPFGTNRNSVFLPFLAILGVYGGYIYR